MPSKLTLIAISVAALSLAAAPAQADKKASVALYKKGKKRFNMGEFEAAIDLFKQAYDEYEAPAYLFNIAQAYRQMEDCKKALFFYERFLAEDPENREAETIRGYMVEMKEMCAAKSAPADLPEAGSESDTSEDGSGEELPTEVADASGDGSALDPASSNEGSGSSEGSTGGSVTGSMDSQEPRGPLLGLSAEMGPAFFNIGEVIVPVSATLRIGAAYPMQFGEVELQAGVSALLSTMAYEEASGDSTVLFTTLLANASARYPLAEGMRVGGEIGVGILRYAGLAQGNPFTVGGMEQTSSHTSLSLRVGATGEYDMFMDGFSWTVSPGFSYAGANEELSDHISSITNLQVLGGAHYRW